jgi:hypothetical protein
VNQGDNSRGRSGIVCTSTVQQICLCLSWRGTRGFHLLTGEWGWGSLPLV